jgi:hypothetical protein
MRVYRRHCRRYILPLFMMMFLAVGLSCLAGEPVTVTLKDGTVVRGELIQMTPEKVKIDPEGAVSLRTIKAEDISTVQLTDKGDVYQYPLSSEQIPGDLRRAARGTSGRGGGFGPIALCGHVGLSIPEGDYYEGIGSGFSFQLAGYYRFDASSPNQGQYFIGISFRQSYPDVEPIIVDYPYYEELDYDMRIRHIGFEFGRTTRPMNGDSYLYVIMGVSLIENKATLDTAPTDGGSIELTYSESMGALRLEGGGVIGLSPSFGLGFDLTWDVVLSRETDYLGMERTSAAGGIVMLSAGIVWEP